MAGKKPQQDKRGEAGTVTLRPLLPQSATGVPRLSSPRSKPCRIPIYEGIFAPRGQRALPTTAAAEGGFKAYSRSPTTTHHPRYRQAERLLIHRSEGEAVSFPYLEWLNGYLSLNPTLLSDATEYLAVHWPVSITRCKTSNLRRR